MVNIGSTLVHHAVIIIPSGLATTHTSFLLWIYTHGPLNTAEQSYFCTFIYFAYQNLPDKTTIEIAIGFLILIFTNIFFVKFFHSQNIFKNVSRFTFDQTVNLSTRNYFSIFFGSSMLNYLRCFLYSSLRFLVRSADDKNYW